MKRSLAWSIQFNQDDTLPGAQEQLAVLVWYPFSLC
jgi:hypothetical protein